MEDEDACVREPDPCDKPWGDVWWVGVELLGCWHDVNAWAGTGGEAELFRAKCQAQARSAAWCGPRAVWCCALPLRPHPWRACRCGAPPVALRPALTARAARLRARALRCDTVTGSGILDLDGPGLMVGSGACGPKALTAVSRPLPCPASSLSEAYVALAAKLAQPLPTHTYSLTPCPSPGIDVMVQVMPDWPYITTPHEVRPWHAWLHARGCMCVAAAPHAYACMRLHGARPKGWPPPAAY